MANTNKARGDRFERAVADYLCTVGVDAERIPAGAANDRGDLWLPPPGPVLQCKDWKSIELAGWVDEMTEQTANAGRPYGFVVAKRRGKGVDQAYLITSLSLGWPVLRTEQT